MDWQDYSMAAPPPKDRWIVFTWSLTSLDNAHVAQWHNPVNGSDGYWQDSEGCLFWDDDLGGALWISLPAPVKGATE